MGTNVKEYFDNLQRASIAFCSFEQAKNKSFLRNRGFSSVESKEILQNVRKLPIGRYII